MMKAESYLNIGYQKILTFERPGGGFDWWGNGEPLIWLTAYGVQQLTALSRVKEIDTEVIKRARGFLGRNQKSNGAWNVGGMTHGETISRVENPSFALTSYVIWSLAEAGFKDSHVLQGCKYIKDNIEKAGNNPYLMSLAANALLSYDPEDNAGLDILKALENIKIEKDDQIYWDPIGQTATCAYGNSGRIETTGMAVLAIIKAKKYADIANKAIQFIAKAKGSYGTWGSTQATILALRCLVESETLQATGGSSSVNVLIGGKDSGRLEINDQNRDVMQILDLGEYTQKGVNELKLDVTGSPNVMYQVVARHYKPWKDVQKPRKEPIELSVDYDRKELERHDTIVANVLFRYNGVNPTFMVIIDLGIPPGFTVDQGDFAELMGEGVIKRYSVTGAQVTLYLGDVTPGQILSFKYHLKAKYPLKVKTPKSTAYEYYSPHINGVSQPVELTVR